MAVTKLSIMVVIVALYWAFGVAVAEDEVAEAVQVIAVAPITDTVDAVENVQLVISTLTVAQVAASDPVPSPSWATPHDGIGVAFPNCTVKLSLGDEIVCDRLIVYVPTPPVPVPYAVIIVPSSNPPPVTVAPMAILPVIVAPEATVSVVLLVDQFALLTDADPYNPWSQYLLAI